MIATSGRGPVAARPYRPSCDVGALVLIIVLDQRLEAALPEHDDLYDPAHSADDTPVLQDPMMVATPPIEFRC